MDGSGIVSAIFFIGLITMVWLWKKKDGTTIKRVGKTFQGFLRWSLEAASSKDLEEIQFRLNRFHDQAEIRLRALETLKPHIDSADINFGKPHSPVSILQDDHPPFLSSQKTPSSAQQTIFCLNLRFTLNELLWTYAGRTSNELLGDEQLSSMIQGPFCPRCLKRVVGRDEENQTTPLPNKCRFCGQWWANPDIDNKEHLQIKDMKRWVYNQIDQEMRTKFQEPSSNE